jgi:hypothetical protein
MKKIIMKRGGVKQVAELLSKHPIVVARALSGNCKETPMNLRIRKCALNHGGVELNEDKWHGDFACDAYKPERMSFTFRNGVHLEIYEPEQQIVLTLPDGEVDRYEFTSDLRLCDVRGLQVMAMNI